MRKILAVSLFAASALACQHDSSGGANPPTSSTTPPTASSASAGGAGSPCPPAKQTSDMCAAVMTYVKDPASGRCCAYPSPCTVPIAGQQFSDSACTTPAGK